MTRRVRLSDFLNGNVEIAPLGTNTTNLRLAKPEVGSDADVWGNNGWTPPSSGWPGTQTAKGLNDNAEILEYVVPNKRGAAEIEGAWNFTDNLVTFENRDAAGRSLRIRADETNTNQVDIYFGDVLAHGDGTLDFGFNFSGAGGGINLYIDGATGDVHTRNDLRAHGGIIVDGDLSVSGKLVLTGNYIEFPNSEPSQIADAPDGALAFDSSRGLIINRLNSVAGVNGTGVYTVIDTKMLGTGNGINITNREPGISGNERIDWSVDTGYLDGLYATLSGGNTLAGLQTLTVANAKGSGLRIQNSAGINSRVEMYFEGSGSGADFLINYHNSGAGDIRLKSNGRLEIGSGSIDVVGGSYLKNGTDLDNIYARLGSNNTFTGAITIGGALTVNGIMDANELRADNGGASDPSFTFRSSQNTGMYYSGTYIQFSQVGAFTARIDPAGTSMSHDGTLVTRQKGDARYAKVADAFVGANIGTRTVPASGSWQTETNLTMVMVRCILGSSDNVDLQIRNDGVSTARTVGELSNSGAHQLCAIVPAGGQWRLNYNGGVNNITVVA